MLSLFFYHFISFLSLFSLSLSIYFYLSVLFIYIYLYLSVYLYLSIYLSVYLSLHLCLSVYQYFNNSIFSNILPFIQFFILFPNPFSTFSSFLLPFSQLCLNSSSLPFPLSTSLFIALSFTPPSSWTRPAALRQTPLPLSERERKSESVPGATNPFIESLIHTQE